MDDEDCKESALLSRMPGCGIFACEKKDFDAYEVVINKAGETKTLEGAGEQLKLDLPGEHVADAVAAQRRSRAEEVRLHDRVLRHATNSTIVQR